MTTTKFQEIKRIVGNYQKTAEKHFKAYNSELTRARERYSPAAFKMESANIWGEHNGVLSCERDTAKRNVNELCKDIQEDFRKWVLKPVSGDLLQTLNCIDKFGMKLSLPELEILREETQNSFFGSRIFGEIAKKNGYYALNIPDAGKFSEALKRVENSATFAIDAYAGTIENDFWGRDIIGQWTFNGVTQGEWQPYHWIIAAQFLSPKSDSIERAEQLFGERDIDITFQVTAEERKRIKGKVESLPSDEAEKKARINELLEAEPDILDKLRLMNDGTLEAIKNYVDSGNWYLSEETAAE